jgi:hypothetical protein
MKTFQTSLFCLSLALLAVSASAQDAMGTTAAHDAMKGSATTQVKKTGAKPKDDGHMMADHAMAASAPSADAGHMMAGHAPASGAMSSDSGHMTADHAMAASGAMGK